MNSESASKSAGKKTAPEPGSREDRLAEALRANLRRRKAQTKGRKQGPQADDASKKGDD